MTPIQSGENNDSRGAFLEALKDWKPSRVLLQQTRVVTGKSSILSLHEIVNVSLFISITVTCREKTFDPRCGPEL